MPRTPTPGRREKILAAAEKLFATRRFHEITLDQVAKAARVGKGTIYLYFKDKDELFFETATHGFEEFCVRLEGVTGRAEPLLPLLRDSCRLLLDFFAERHRTFKLLEGDAARLMQAHFRQHWRERHRRLHVCVRELLARGIRENVLRADATPDLLTMFLLGLLRASHFEAEHADTGAVEVDQILDFFCHGAMPRAGASSVAPKPAAARGVRRSAGKR